MSKIKSLLKTTKGKIIAGSGAALVVAAVVMIFVLKNKDTYRSIIVKAVEGDVNVVGDINNGQAYSGQRLYGGDDVTVADSSSLTMLMDNDKYMFADANTHFKLIANDSKTSSRIRIELDKGSELSELQSKLGEDDSYEIDTPNSTMSVRGTKFRVTIYRFNDIVYTLLEVTNGVVFVQLQTEDGKLNGVEQEFYEGESALIRGNFDFSEFVPGKDGQVVRHLDYDGLPEDAVDRLIALLVDELGLEIPTDNNDPTTEDVTTETTEKSTDKTTTEKTTQTTTEKTTSTTTESTTRSTTESTTEGTTEKQTEATNHTHSFGDWKTTKAPTCTASGTEERKCSGCGTVESRTVAATGHKYSDWSTTLATCTEDGYKIRTCTNCGNEEKEVLKATGHKFSDYVVTTAAKCTTNGTETRTCSACSAKESRSIPALGHDYSAYVVTTEPGCLTTGVETSTCSRCGDKLTRTIDAEGHYYGEWVTSRNADCGQNTDGERYKVCTKCGDTVTETIPWAHEFGDWTYFGVESCERGIGEQSHTCSVCGETVTERFTPREHQWVQITDDAVGVYWYCEICRATTYTDPN